MLSLEKWISDKMKEQEEKEQEEKEKEKEEFAIWKTFFEK